MSESPKPVNRICGPCTECCDGRLPTEVEGVPLRPGMPCQHVIPGVGCGIHERRPERPCRVFFCGWIMHPELLDDDLRPDLCGTIAIMGRKWRDWDVIILAPAGERVPPETLERYKSVAVETNRCLMYAVRSFEDGQYTGQKVLGYGPADFAEQLQNAVLPDDIFTPS